MAGVTAALLAQLKQHVADLCNAEAEVARRVSAYHKASDPAEKEFMVGSPQRDPSPIMAALIQDKLEDMVSDCDDAQTVAEGCMQRARETQAKLVAHLKGRLSRTKDQAKVAALIKQAEGLIAGR